MAAGEVAAPGAAIAGEREGRRISLAEPVVFVLSIASALAFWELVSRTGAISQKDLPAMSTTFRELWSLVQTSHFWFAFGDTVRGMWGTGVVGAVPAVILAGSIVLRRPLRRRWFAGTGPAEWQATAQ
jgi:ABC-type nitrate/sulfonate/bicarbonate transport system permease component